MDADANFRNWYFNTGHYGAGQWLWREGKTTASHWQIYHSEIAMRFPKQGIAF